MLTPAKGLNLNQWIERISSINLNEVELGLSRVGRVWRRMGAPRVAAHVIAIAGTNGKGTCANFLDRSLRADGAAVGLYTSPHLLRFNERIVVNGCSASDELLCAAFEHIDRARAGVLLTFFEFTTLAALWCFSEIQLDVAVLEVGLGGRLDAVNVIDADVAVVTRIGLDHTDYLGTSLASIAREKAGIFRPGTPAIIASSDAPGALVDVARERDADVYQRDVHFFCEKRQGVFDWRDDNHSLEGLVAPNGAALDSFAGALKAMVCVERLPDSEILTGVLADWQLSGRQQYVAGSPSYLLDVAHNVQAAQHLAQRLRDEPARVRVVLGMLADKDTAAFVNELREVVDHWHVVGVEGARGLSACELELRVRKAGISNPCASSSVAGALARERASAAANDLIVVCGSFHVVGPALAWLGLYSPSLTI